MNDNQTMDLITVRQLPIIEEQLQSVSEEIRSRVEGIRAMDVTEDNYKEIKKYRADFRKLISELEARRIAVKKQVMQPYEAFEAIYKQYITDVYKPADTEISGKIKFIEDALKAQKITEAQDYCAEYAASLGIDFVTFPDVGIEVTMNVSRKRLREACKEYLDRVAEDLQLIKTQQHAAEILVEYKTSRNVSRAITLVNDRHARIEEERRNAQMHDAEADAMRAAEQKVDDAISAAEAEGPEAAEAFAPPAEIESAEEATPAKKYVVAFRYETADLESIRRIKAEMERNGTYEQL